MPFGYFKHKNSNETVISVARDSINAVILRLEHFCQFDCDPIGLILKYH